MASRLTICALASLTLTACATTGGPGRSDAADAYAERFNADYDATKVAAVQQWAQVHGATVFWVNYPTKKTGGN